MGPDDSVEQQRRSAANSARLGIRGPIGWILHPERTRSAVAAVSPATARGTVNTLLWFAALAGVVVGGRAVAPVLGFGWVVIGLVVMVPIGWNWPFGADREREPLVGQPPQRP